MKTFFAILGAILSAGLIFLVATGLFTHCTEWEHRKLAVIDDIQRNSTDFETAYASTLTETRSVESIRSAVQDMQKAADREHQAYGLLESILQQKPFLPLNAEEQKWLSKARREMGTQAKDQTANPTRPLPPFVTLTLDTSVYDENNTEIPIRAGTKLKVVNYSGNELFFEYDGKTFHLPAAITDFKKY